MTDQEALDIYQAGQDLLCALHPHYSGSSLCYFDAQLSTFYDLAGLEHALCPSCGADCPVQLIKGAECVGCLLEEDKT